MREFVYGYPIDGLYDFELYKDSEGKYENRFNMSEKLPFDSTIYC